MSALWVAMHNVSAFPTVVYDHPRNCPFKDTPRAGCIIAHKERFFHLAQSASGGREVNESMFDDRWASSAIQSMLDQVSVESKKSTTGSSS